MIIYCFKKSLFKRGGIVGEILVHHETQADGKVVITERQIKGEEMHTVS